MRHRWGICGEELVLAVVMSVVFAGWLGPGAGKVMASGIEKASFSAGPAVSANFILGAHRVPGRMTAGWSVCWRSAGKTDARCVDIEVAWGNQLRMKSQ
jgi:hypothetical protein